MAHCLAIFDGGQSGGAFLPALKAVLCSPHFLYLTVLAGPLDDYALASRLSYFLRSSCPDAELLASAAAARAARPGKSRGMRRACFAR